MATIDTDKLRELREEKGYTIALLSEKTGVSKTFIFEMESVEDKNASLKTLSLIAKELGVKLSYLLKDD